MVQQRTGKHYAYYNVNKEPAFIDSLLNKIMQ